MKSRIVTNALSNANALKHDDLKPLTTTTQQSLTGALLQDLGYHITGRQRWEIDGSDESSPACEPHRRKSRDSLVPHPSLAKREHLCALEWNRAIHCWLLVRVERGRPVDPVDE